MSQNLQRVRLDAWKGVVDEVLPRAAPSLDLVAARVRSSPALTRGLSDVRSVSGDSSSAIHAMKAEMDRRGDAAGRAWVGCLEELMVLVERFCGELLDPPRRAAPAGASV